IVINGVVEGDVVAFSNRVEITGRVGGSVRVAATSVVVEGEVENDLFAGAFTVQAAAGSSIGRDALVWSRTAELLGDIERDFEGTQSRTRLAGTVGGNVDITTAGLTLLPGLDVPGDLRYIADDEATVAQTI